MEAYSQSNPAPAVDPVFTSRMKRLAVLERVRGVLVKTSCRDVPQEDGVRLHEDLELDSAERIETAMRLEEEFGVALSDDEVDQMCMSTLGGITDYLMSQKRIA